MSVEYILIVPAIPPTANHYRGRRRDGGEYRKPAAARFDLLVQGEWNHHHGKTLHVGTYMHRKKERFIRCDYAVDVLFQLGPSHRRNEPDVMNLEKVAVDALEHCKAIVNDKWISDIALHKQWGDCDRTVYTVRVLGSTEDHPIPPKPVKIVAAF